ncbi:hypothetical protein UlMin_003547 [Ulmus minor]
MIYFLGLKSVQTKFGLSFSSSQLSNHSFKPVNLCLEAVYTRKLNSIPSSSILFSAEWVLFRFQIKINNFRRCWLSEKSPFYSLQLHSVQPANLFPSSLCVLYVDIDVHHGDGVEEAFYSTDRVMTVSFHTFVDFFPGYALNVLLNDGLDDEYFLGLFRPILHKVMEVYQPDAVVLQRGADSFSGVWLGCFNSVEGHADCLRFLRSFEVPLMVLGGGGCTIRNVACCWCYETAVAVDVELDNRLPQNEYYEYFGPDYTLRIDPCNMENLNNLKDMEKISLLHPDAFCIKTWFFCFVLFSFPLMIDFLSCNSVPLFYSPVKSFFDTLLIWRSHHHLRGTEFRVNPPEVGPHETLISELSEFKLFSRFIPCPSIVHLSNLSIRA